MRPGRLLALLGSTTVACGLLLATPAYADAPVPTLLANGGFETGGTNHWTCEDNRVVTDPVRSGAYALSGVASNNSTGLCTQTVGVRPNSTYWLSASVRGRFVHLGATGYGSATSTSSRDAWTPLTNSFRTGPNTTTVQLYVHGWYAQGTYFADDVALYGTPPIAPGTPTDVRVTATSSRSATLSWTPIAGAAGYRIYLVGGALAHDTGSPTPTAEVSLGPNWTSKLQVTAYNSTGESLRSESVTVTTPPDEQSPPYAPRGVSAHDAPTSDALWTAWEAVQTAASGYNVYVDGVLTARTYGPAYRITTLAENRTYRIEITAVNDIGESAKSRPAYATTLPAGATLH